jgi:hypothetical protein
VTFEADLSLEKRHSDKSAKLLRPAFRSWVGVRRSEADPATLVHPVEATSSN